MKTTLYYFSGTGNSLAAARQVADTLGDSDLVPIASLNQSGDIIAPFGRIGIICPIYDMGIPVIVRDFLTRLVVEQSTYCFALLTYGGMGAAALKMVNAGLLARNGRGLSAGFLLKMPGNFIPLYNPLSSEKQEATLRSAQDSIPGICSKIIANEENSVGIAPFTSLLQYLLYGGFSKGVHTVDEKFTVSDTCTSCGICVSVCPTRNITLTNDRPVWHHRCEMCCGCLNYCPVQAIDLHVMLGTKGRGRYHHPRISVSDLKSQQG
jgi:ferredoxin